MIARPTPRRLWVKVGDACVAVGGTMRGQVLRVIRHRSLPVAIVRWASGATGRHSITTLVKVPPLDNDLS